MPQYPMPPWPPLGGPRYPRASRVGMDNPRFAHVPLVILREDLSVVVVRGEADVASKLTHDQRFHCLHQSCPMWFAENRLGQIKLLVADKPTIVGLLEFYLYTATYRPPSAIREATSFAELGEALDQEVERVKQLEANGWELVEYGD